MSGIAQRFAFVGLSLGPICGQALSVEFCQNHGDAGKRAQELIHHQRGDLLQRRESGEASRVQHLARLAELGLSAEATSLLVRCTYVL